MKNFYLMGLCALLSLTAAAQWPATLDDPLLLFPAGTNNYGCDTRTNGGYTWTYMYHPNTKDAVDEYDTGNVVYEIRVQCFNPDGVAQFPEEGLLVSDYSNWSWTTVNEHLIVDNEGNAIVAVDDCRNSQTNYKSFSVYKISPSGEMLWGEDGVNLNGTEAHAYTTAMNICQLDNGNTVFAWQDEPTQEDQFQVRVQIVTPDGQTLLNNNELCLQSATKPYNYPYVVNAGNNEFILVSLQGAGQVVYAQKYNDKGEAQWNKQTRIYRGGFPSGGAPVWTFMQVIASGDGGAVISWRDDRNGENRWSNFISYVKNDGTLGFEGASDEADVKLSLNENVNHNAAKVMVAPDGNGFIAVWDYYDRGAQTWHGVQAQRISRTGELMWGDEGKELVPYEEHNTGYVSVCPADEGNVCAFYMMYNAHWDTPGYARKINAQSGEPVWEQDLQVSPSMWVASSLESAVFDDHSWLLTWKSDCKYEEIESGNKLARQPVTRINFDGTFAGATGIATPQALTNDGQTRYYDLSGRMVSKGKAGIYVKKQGNETTKIILK